MEALRAKVAQLLKEKAISGFLGLKLEHGHPSPFLFTGEEGLDLLVVSDTRFPLTKLLQRLTSKYPEEKFGVMVRGCDERSLIELHKDNQVNLEHLVTVGVACSQELAQRCGCKVPYPSQFEVGEPATGVEGGGELESIEGMAEDERFNFWMEQFGKCIKCYGCRNSCPLCYCSECTLEDSFLVPPGETPPKAPIFHLIRAFHTVGRCIDCGLCEEACPVGIPLRTIYKKLGQVVSELFGYSPGKEVEGRSPLSFLGEKPFKEQG